MVATEVGESCRPGSLLGRRALKPVGQGDTGDCADITHGDLRGDDHAARYAEGHHERKARGAVETCGEDQRRYERERLERAALERHGLRLGRDEKRGQGAGRGSGQLQALACAPCKIAFTRQQGWAVGASQRTAHVVPGLLTREPGQQLYVRSLIGNVTLGHLP